MAQDFIGKEGQVSAYGNQLIVNADQRKIDELKALSRPTRHCTKTPADHRRHQRKQLASGDQGYSVNGANRARPASSIAALTAGTAESSRSRRAMVCQR
jgi:hypothetical protein